MTRKRIPDRAALLKSIAAESAEAGHAVGEIDLVIVLEALAVGRRQDRGGHGDHVFMIEALIGNGRHERASDPQHRIASDFQVQVRRAVLDGDFQEVVDVHPVGLSALGAA